MLRLLGNSFFRTLCSPHLNILTDRELILIQEGVGKCWACGTRYGGAKYGGVKYGGVWSYIPLDKITSISTTDAENDLWFSTGTARHIPAQSVSCVISHARPACDTNFLPQRYKLIGLSALPCSGQQSGGQLRWRVILTFWLLSRSRLAFSCFHIISPETRA